MCFHLGKKISWFPISNKMQISVCSLYFNKKLNGVYFLGWDYDEFLN
jgi:hypothetical protein